MNPKRNLEFTISTRGLQHPLEEIRTELLPLLKSMANGKRLDVLIALLGGSRSFQALLHLFHIQKTALANHLTNLTQVSLIRKPEYGTYEITEDGVHFLRILLQGWNESLRAQEKKAQLLQRRAMSSRFVDMMLEDHHSPIN